MKSVIQRLIRIIASEDQTTCPLDGSRTDWNGSKTDENGQTYQEEICAHCGADIHVYDK